MSNEIAVPDYLREMMSSADAPQTENMVSGGTSTPRISLKGSKFRFKEDGEEVEVIKEALDCVIVGVMPEHGTCKTFYEGAYNPDSSDPPDCSSTDGISPDPWVTSPVNQFCATCPNNKFGSAIAQSGKKSKACRDSRRLYIVKAKDLKEQDEPKAWLLNVTVSSLKPFNGYSKELAKAGLTTPSVVVTRLSFDEDADFPKLEFKLMGTLNEGMAKSSLAIAKEKDWDFGTQQKAIGNDKQSMPAISNKVVNETVEKVASEGGAVSEDKPVSREATESVDNILETWD